MCRQVFWQQTKKKNYTQRTGNKKENGRERQKRSRNKIRKQKENLKNNTIPLQELENNTLKENTISIKEDITNTKEKELNIDIKEETEDIKPTTKNDIYTLEDYKKFIAMLTKLKDFTNSNNVSIDDAVTISLINNYSIDDCLKFKEILENNLN